MINLSRDALQAILNNEELLQSLENMEAFRSLRKITAEILTAEQSIKQAKSQGKPSKSIRNKMNKRRKEIQDALLQFLTKVPIFMYLTDYREESLVDVIRNVEPALFTKVTGLKIKDFDTLCQLGVFNTQILNQSIYAFKRQEAQSFLGAKSTQFLTENDQENLST